MVKEGKGRRQEAKEGEGRRRKAKGGEEERGAARLLSIPSGAGAFPAFFRKGAGFAGGYFPRPGGQAWDMAGNITAFSWKYRSCPRRTNRVQSSSL